MLLSIRNPDYIWTCKLILDKKKISKYNFIQGQVKSTVYNILHAKKISLGNLKTKEDAVNKAIELLGEKASLYGLI